MKGTPKGRARKGNPKPKQDRAPQGTKRDAAARMERFALAYFAEPNATKAAIAAGYAESGADATGARLLGTDKVLTRLRLLGEQAASAKIAQAQERQEFLTAVMRGEVMDHSLFFGQVTPVPASVQNRLKAAEQLNKMHGSFVERHEITGKDGGPVQTEQANGIPDDERAERLAALLARVQGNTA